MSANHGFGCVQPMKPLLLRFFNGYLSMWQCEIKHAISLMGKNPFTSFFVLPKPYLSICPLGAARKRLESSKLAKFNEKYSLSTRFHF